MEAKTKPFAQESANSLGKQSDKETVKPKMQSSVRTEEQTISLVSHQKSLQEASKLAADASKTSVPVSMKKMSWNTSEESKPRPKAQEGEGAAASEQKVSVPFAVFDLRVVPLHSALQPCQHVTKFTVQTCAELLQPKLTETNGPGLE